MWGSTAARDRRTRQANNPRAAAWRAGSTPPSCAYPDAEGAALPALHDLHHMNTSDDVSSDVI